MVQCKIHDIPGLDLNKYTPHFSGQELLKQIYMENSQILKAHNVKLNIEQTNVYGMAPCSICSGSDFIKTGCRFFQCNLL